MTDFPAHRGLPTPLAFQTEKNETPRAHFSSGRGIDIGRRPIDMDESSTDDFALTDGVPSPPAPELPDQDTPPPRIGWSLYKQLIGIGAAVASWLLLIILTIFTSFSFLSFVLITLLGVAVYKGVTMWQRSKRIAEKTKQLHTESGARKRKVAVFNSNGGSGKSTVIGTLSTLWSIVSRKPVVLADFNYNSGHVLERVGIRENTTVRVDTVHARLGERGLLRRMIDDLPTTDHYLTGIDRVSEIRKTDELDREAVGEVIGALSTEFHDVFIDNGNDVTGEYEQASAITADVALFAANTGKRESLGDVARTMRNMEANDIDGLTERSLVVLCRPYCWPFGRLNEIPELDPSIKVLPLPWDFHLLRVRYGNPLNFNKLRQKTHEALLDIALEVCRMSPPHGERLTPEIDPEEWVNRMIEESRAGQTSHPNTPQDPEQPEQSN